MPIRGLSEQRRFSRGGKIRLGTKQLSKKTGNEYPEKSDHFIADFEDPELEKKFYEIYGSEPKRIRVCFPSEDLEQVFPVYYKCWGVSGLLCKGDGEKAMRWEKGGQVECECLGPAECEFSLARKDKSGKPGCDKECNLLIFLPDLPVFQVFQIDSGGRNTIINMLSAFDLLRSTCGRISFVPVDLVLRPMNTTIPDSGKKTVIFALDVVINKSLKEVSELRPLIAGPAPQLPPPSEDMPDDLHPASLVRAQDEHKERVQAVYAENELGFTVDAETGEVLDGPDEPEPEDLGSDPDVARAFEAAGFPPAKRQAMLASATDKAALLHIISVNAANGSGRTSKPAAKTETKQQPPQAERADDPLADGATLF
ncbi:MAG: hypothetical protein RBU21_25170 [FCB group bacterium]|jgi:hypothetical protein|nr:hypothetical protein [FCB group bacterium]